MANPLYMLTCLNCGGGLEPYAGDPDGAPWVCHGCHLGFWVSELSQEARALYRPRFNDFGRFRDTEALRGRCHAERADARARGTSCLPEHIGLLEATHLRFLHERFPLSDEFRAQILARLEG